MKLEKQEICVWVSVNNYPEIKNEIADTHIIKTNNGIVSYGVFYKDKMISYDITLGKVTHWLKPIKDVFVLTRDDLVHLAFEAKKDNQLAVQFIESLTK